VLEYGRQRLLAVGCLADDGDARGAEDHPEAAANEGLIVAITTPGSVAGSLTGPQQPRRCTSPPWRSGGVAREAGAGAVEGIARLIGPLEKRRRCHPQKRRLIAHGFVRQTQPGGTVFSPGLLS
jgi:hypothetical protein